MTKRKKHDWKLIKAEYEIGKAPAYLVKKYDVPFSTLSTKVKKEGWVASEVEINAIRGFKEATEVITSVITNKDNTPEKLDVLVEAVNTTLEDNKLIQNNRKLASMAQSILLNHKKDFNHQNIRNLTGAIRDIESISNPPQKQYINIMQHQNQEVIKEIKVTFED